MLSFDLTEVWFWIWMFFHSQVTSKQKYYKKPPQKTKQNKKNRHMDSASRWGIDLNENPSPLSNALD